jgi:hypothetical protein
MQQTISKKTSKLRQKTLLRHPFFENKQYNESLRQLTLFPYINREKCGSISRVTLFFRFRSIEFNKKRSLPFFIARELLTSFKPVASLSDTNIQA